MADTALIVFARAPRPGEVKTRLIERFGAAGAAAIYQQLLAATLRAAERSTLTARYLYCSDAASRAWFDAELSPQQWTVRVQCDGDLGLRMHDALQAALRAHPAAVLIGSDIPDIDEAHLHAAAGVLGAGADAVLGPSDDGGFYLVGLREAADDVFNGVAWSSGSELDGVRARLRQRGWRWQELETLFDVDTPADVARWQPAARMQR